MPIALTAFSALRHRNFRLFYGGQLLSLTGSWMQTTALGWLVYELTDSEFLLGLVTARTAFPVLLFPLFAGVMADRLEKRRILVTAQASMLVVAFVLAVMTHMGVITVGWILLLVFLHGTGSAFEIPTRQSFFVDLVGKEDLTNAIALNSSAFNLTRIVGPAAAGAIISAVSIAACFYLNAASYLFVLGSLLAIRLPRFRPDPAPQSKWDNLKEGFAYLREDRVARSLITMVAAVSILGIPYATLMPVFARDILEVGAQGLGYLLAAVGLGAVVGGFTMAALGTRIPRGRLLFVSTIGFCIFLSAFALSPWFWLSMGMLVIFGFMMILTTATANAIIQSQVPDRLRGRVMAVYVFMFLGMVPLGSLQAGAVASWLGAPTALTIGAGLLLVIWLVLWSRAPNLRAVE